MFVQLNLSCVVCNKTVLCSGLYITQDFGKPCVVWRVCDWWAMYKLSLICVCLMKQEILYCHECFVEFICDSEEEILRKPAHSAWLHIKQVWAWKSTEAAMRGWCQVCMRVTYGQIVMRVGAMCVAICGWLCCMFHTAIYASSRFQCPTWLLIT